MKRAFASIALAAGLITAPAIAAEIELTKEIQGASIHETGVDMVVYYTKDGERLEVVATYVEDGDAANPNRMRMGLMDGDNVTFALPGRMETNYTFSRAGQTVRVKSTPSGYQTKVAKAAN